MNDRFPRLAKLATHLERLTVDPNARVAYELLSHGLIWSDESPPIGSVEFEIGTAARALWRFRSSLILGSPDERFRDHWEFAQQVCPNWPGLLAERRDAKWRELFEQGAKRLENVFEDLDERWRAQQSANAKPISTENVTPQYEIRI
jgi:hypothetical protein